LFRLLILALQLRRAISSTQKNKKKEEQQGLHFNWGDCIFVAASIFIVFGYCRYLIILKELSQFKVFLSWL
jgi:hypothetical protein